MKYLYFTLYRLLTKVKTNDTPEWSAMLLISLFEITNIITLSLLLPKSMQTQYETKNQALYDGIVISIVVIIINYLILITNTKNLSEKYDSETGKQKAIGIAVLSLYCLISALSVYFVSNYVNGFGL